MLYDNAGIIRIICYAIVSFVNLFWCAYYLYKKQYMRSLNKFLFCLYFSGTMVYVLSDSEEDVRIYYLTPLLLFWTIFSIIYFIKDIEGINTNGNLDS